MSDVEKTRLSIKEASKVTGLSTSKLYKLSAKRRIPLEKIDRRVLIPRRALEEWLEEHRAEIKQ